MKKLDYRIKAVFGQSNNYNKNEVFEILEIIRANLSSNNDNIRKSLILIFGLMIVYELVLTDTIEKISISISEISDLNLVIKGLPAIIGYVYYELMAMIAMRRILMETHFNLIEIFDEKIAEKSLQTLFVPVSTFSTNLFFTSKNKRAKGILYNYGGLIGITVTLVPVIFIVYAYINCIGKFGFMESLGFITIPITLIFLINGLYFFFKTDRIT